MYSGDNFPVTLKVMAMERKRSLQIMRFIVNSGPLGGLKSDSTQLWMAPGLSRAAAVMEKRVATEYMRMIMAMNFGSLLWDATAMA